MIKMFNMDCMEYMRTVPDKYFDLAIVDPPYGIGRDGGESGKNWKKYEKKGWDSCAPNEDYFLELKRISDNQIIWGANYFTRFLDKSMGWIVWDKGQKLTMSDGELAYTSFERALRICEFNRCYIGDNGGLLHPTQKPVKLYQWLLQNYAKPEFKILDTHLGSGSSAIAAHYFGIAEFVGTELDEDYYKACCERFKNATAQQALF